MGIVNIPAKEDFFEEAFLCANRATQIVDEIFRARHSARFAGVKIKERSDEDHYELACQHLLKNALVLLQQAYEMYFRGEICGVSPYLLIPDQRDWVSPAAAKDLNFSEIRSVNAGDLPKLYTALGIGVSSDGLVSNFSDLRRIRNGLVHGIGRQSICEHKLLTQINLLLQRLGYENLLTSYIKYMNKSHAFILFDYWDEVNFAHKFIGSFRSVLGANFFDTTLMRLNGVADDYCPVCFAEFDQERNAVAAFQKTTLRKGRRSKCFVCSGLSEACEISGGYVALYDSARLNVLIKKGHGEIVRLLPEAEIESLYEVIGWPDATRRQI